MPYGAVRRLPVVLYAAGMVLGTLSIGIAVLGVGPAPADVQAVPSPGPATTSRPVHSTAASSSSSSSSSSSVLATSDPSPVESEGRTCETTASGAVFCQGPGETDPVYVGKLSEVLSAPLSSPAVSSAPSLTTSPATTAPTTPAAGVDDDADPWAAVGAVSTGVGSVASLVAAGVAVRARPNRPAPVSASPRRTDRIRRTRPPRTP